MGRVDSPTEDLTANRSTVHWNLCPSSNGSPSAVLINQMKQTHFYTKKILFIRKIGVLFNKFVDLSLCFAAGITNMKINNIIIIDSLHTDRKRFGGMKCKRHQTLCRLRSIFVLQSRIDAKL